MCTLQKPILNLWATVLSNIIKFCRITLITACSDTKTCVLCAEMKNLQAQEFQNQLSGKGRQKKRWMSNKGTITAKLQKRLILLYCRGWFKRCLSGVTRILIKCLFIWFKFEKYKKCGSLKILYRHKRNFFMKLVTKAVQCLCHGICLK